MRWIIIPTVDFGVTKNYARTLAVQHESRGFSPHSCL